MRGEEGGLQALLPTFTSAASVLFNSGRAAVISPVGEQERESQAWGVKEILKTTHSSHQNKSGRIKGTQKMSFFAGVGGGLEREGGTEGGREGAIVVEGRSVQREANTGESSVSVCDAGYR